MTHCLRFLIAGRVQGVFYRASTQRVANSHGLRGYVRNLADGRVEVLACGEEQSVRALGQWLWQGPDLASVDSVDVEEVDDVDVPDRFVVR